MDVGRVKELSGPL